VSCHKYTAAQSESENVHQKAKPLYNPRPSQKHYLPRRSYLRGLRRAEGNLEVGQALVAHSVGRAAVIDLIGVGPSFAGAAVVREADFTGASRVAGLDGDALLAAGHDRQVIGGAGQVRPGAVAELEKSLGCPLVLVHRQAQAGLLEWGLDGARVTRADGRGRRHLVDRELRRDLVDGKSVGLVAMVVDMEVEGVRALALVQVRVLVGDGTGQEGRRGGKSQSEELHFRCGAFLKMVRRRGGIV